MVFSIWNLAINEANAGLYCKVDLGGNKSVWHCRSQDLFFDASGQWETCAKTKCKDVTTNEQAEKCLNDNCHWAKGRPHGG